MSKLPKLLDVSDDKQFMKKAKFDSIFKTGRHCYLNSANETIPFTVEDYLKHFPNMNLSQFPPEIQEEIVFRSSQVPKLI